MRRPLCFVCTIFVLVVMLFMTVFEKSLAQKVLPPNRYVCSFYGQIYNVDYKDDKSVLYLKDVHINSQIKNINSDCDFVENNTIEGQNDIENRYQVICYVPNAPNMLEELLPKNSQKYDVKNNPKYSEKRPEWKIGSFISGEGKVRHFDAATNDGQFDAKKYYRIMKLDFSIQDVNDYVCWESNQENGFKNCWWILNYLQRVKYVLAENIDDGLSEKDAGVLKAMLLGVKSDLLLETKGLYQRNGIAHIIAISGMHILLWGMGINRLLRGISVPLPIANFISFVFVVLYGILTGNQASAIRSVLMFFLFLLAPVVRRTYDMLTAMALAAALLLLVNPLYVFHSGFLLSFAAVAGIALLFPWFSNLFLKKSLAERMMVEELPLYKKIVRKGKDFVASSCFISLSVSLVSAPIQIYFFYTIPTYSVFINLFIAPFISALMLLGMAGAVLGVFSKFLAGLFFVPCHYILSFYEKICFVFDKLPFAHPVIAKPALWRIVLYYALLVGIVCAYRIQNRNDRKYDIENKKSKKGRIKCKKTCYVVAMGINLFILCIHIRMATSVTMLDVGQGDCFIIEEKAGTTIMIDGGSSSVSQVGTYRIEPFLRSHGISKIDYLFLSHADSDHINGVQELMEDEAGDKIKIGYLVLTECAKGKEEYKELLYAANERKTKVEYIKQGDRLSAGEVDLVCLCPGDDNAAVCLEGELEGSQERQMNYQDATKRDENDQSMVLLLTCRNQRMLFMGDMSSEHEMDVLQSLKSLNIAMDKLDYLKVGHHGSKYSSSVAFLEKLNIQNAFISSGKNNRYGHPHEETLERLHDVEADIFRTDQSGMVRVNF